VWGRTTLRRHFKLKTDLIENVKKVDDVDLRIINLLQENSRLSYNKIASKLGISVGTAYNRVKNLENEGVLKGYTVILDMVKLGYSLTAIILIQTEGGHLTDVQNEIAKTANAIAVYEITGDYAIVVISKFQDRSSLSAFIKNLLAMPHVKRTVTNVSLDITKEDFGVRLDSDAKKRLMPINNSDE
jgi:DNA-binding Lrp family transcriptional regulator